MLETMWARSWPFCKKKWSISDLAVGSVRYGRQTQNDLVDIWRGKANWHWPNQTGIPKLAVSRRLVEICATPMSQRDFRVLERMAVVAGVARVVVIHAPRPPRRRRWGWRSLWRSRLGPRRISSGWQRRWHPAQCMHDRQRHGAVDLPHRSPLDGHLPLPPPNGRLGFVAVAGRIVLARLAGHELGDMRYALVEGWKLIAGRGGPGGPGTGGLGCRPGARQPGSLDGPQALGHVRPAATARARRPVVLAAAVHGEALADVITPCLAWLGVRRRGARRQVHGVQHRALTAPQALTALV